MVAPSLMPPIDSQDSCSRCPSHHNLQLCSKCQSVWYCSLKCELAGFKSHKRQCQILDGSDPPLPSTSDPPTLVEAVDCGDKTLAGHGMPPQTPLDPDVILGVKIHPSGYSSNLSSRGFNPCFVQESFTPTDEIFAIGELCPVTESYGIPILIRFRSRRPTSIYSDAVYDRNLPALELRLSDGSSASSVSWSASLTDSLSGTAFVVRRDRKPLAKETVETMYQFHLFLRRSNSFKSKCGTQRPLAEVTPADFREFSETYWTEQAANLERERYQMQLPFIHRVFSGSRLIK